MFNTSSQCNVKNKSGSVANGAFQTLRLRIKSDKPRSERAVKTH